MKLNTNPLKGKYPITVRIAGLCGIFSLVLIFLVFPRFVTESEFGTVDQIVIENMTSHRLNRSTTLLHQQGLPYQYLQTMKILQMM